MQEELTHISHLEENFSVYPHVYESSLRPDASASSRAELDSYAASQTPSRQSEYARGDGLSNSSESAYKATSLGRPTSQDQIVESPSHQWPDFTVNIPGFLSPYPRGKGFSARDSNRYMTFCRFKIDIYYLCIFG
jgi:hypothetical protein